jgi:hypothetical protein
MIPTICAILLIVGKLATPPAMVAAGTQVASKCWDKGRNRGILDGVECVEEIHGTKFKGRVADAVLKMISKVR